LTNLIYYLLKPEEPSEGHFKISLNFVKAIRRVGVKVSLNILNKYDILSPIIRGENKKALIHIFNIDELRFLLTKLSPKYSCTKFIKHVFYPYSYVRTAPSIIAQVRNKILGLNTFDALTTNSKLVAAYLKTIGVENKKIYFINTPVDENLLFPSQVIAQRARIENNIPLNDKVILYIGQIESVRGTFELLKAFKSIVRLHSTKLVFASPNTKYERIFLPSFYKLIKELDLQTHVSIIGYVKDVNKVYNLADIVVLPFQGPYKITDPPLTILETLSCAKPLITTPYGTVKQIIKDQVNGFFTGPTAEEIASVLYRVLNMKEEELASVKKCARETILRNYSLEVVGKQLIKLYSFVNEN
jgi:glycosyltransferase involved in cell wall biosynthesis